MKSVPSETLVQQPFVAVAVDAPISSKLTYKQNENFFVQRGDVVDVSLGKRQVKGLVLGGVSSEEAQANSEFEIKSVVALDESFHKLSDIHLKWVEWLADYYMHPVGQVAQMCYPSLPKQTKERKSKRASVIPEYEPKKQFALNEEQQKCYEAIAGESGFATHLLFGVTGSGKTEIYLELFDKVLKEGKKGLFLLPEIALTPQLIKRFAQRFGDQIAVLHSQLTDRERTNQWWDIVTGNKKILIGARSALFCPIDNLGLIVVDEEHESSFKQDETLKYNGRDSAIMLGYFNKCPVVLGSATPSLETWKNAIDKKYKLHTIKNRVNNRPLPDVEIVDLREDKEKPKQSIEKPSWLSEALYQEMLISLEKNEQVALLLNRRGMSQVVFCPSCGHTSECPNCDISLTLHANIHLVCHYCDYHENYKTKCPDCNEGEVVPMGLGTEKVEQDLRQLFPDKVIARADRDEVSSRAEMEELVDKMEKNEINILIGTQMIAKGLDFSNLKLVGLLLADIGFNLPDFRATEKSFQLVTQMSGRSGRHVKEDESAGKVFIQTYNPTHESLTYAKNSDYTGFAGLELMNREQLNYPPFHKLVAIRIQGPSLEAVRNTADMARARAEQIKEKYAVFAEVEILGPAAAPIAKLRNNFRYHLLLKAPQAKILNQYMQKLVGNSKWVAKQTKLVVDVDPLNLL